MEDVVIFAADILDADRRAPMGVQRERGAHIEHQIVVKTLIGVGDGIGIVDRGVDAIAVVSREVHDAQLQELAPVGGFVYCPVSGVSDLALGDLFARVSEVTGLPFVVGIDTLEAIPQGVRSGDGVLARTGLAEAMSSHPDDEIMLEVSDQVRALKEALGRAGQ